MRVRFLRGALICGRAKRCPARRIVVIGLAPIMFTPSARLLHKSYTHLINLVSLTGTLRRYIILTIKMFARGSTTNRKTQPYHGKGRARLQYIANKEKRSGGGAGADGVLVPGQECH